MSQLTQAQVIEYNKKVTAAKEKASQDKARKDLAEKELERTCKELSDLLGKEITPENLQAEYEAFVEEAQKTIESGTKILNGLEEEQAEALDTKEVEEVKQEAPVVTPKSDGVDLDDLLGLN